MDRALDRAVALLTAQHGVAHVAQLRRHGVRDVHVGTRVRSGSWCYVARDVVAVAGGAETWLRRVWLAVVTVGTRADGTLRPVAVGGLAAAGLHDVVPEVETVVEVVVGRGTWCPRAPGVRVREVRDWPERGFVRVHGLLTTALPDTLVDVAPYFTDGDYLTLLQDQCFGRPGLLRRVVGRCHRGSNGSARARRVAAVLARGLDSVLHARAFAVLDAAGLRPAHCDHEVVAGAGGSDCVYLSGGRPVLALEFDGDLHRLSRKAFLHDRAKDLALRSEGCATLRLTVEQVDRPAHLVAVVRGALADAELTVPPRTSREPAALSVRAEDAAAARRTLGG